jgi:hypothetical protein
MTDPDSDLDLDAVAWTFADHGVASAPTLVDACVRAFRRLGLSSTLIEVFADAEAADAPRCRAFGMLAVAADAATRRAPAASRAA